MIKKLYCDAIKKQELSEDNAARRKELIGEENL